MTFDALGELNWLAVIAAAIAYFAVGSIWYAPPVFGNVWMRAAGIQPPAEGQGPNPIVFVAPLVTGLVASIATGMLALVTGTDTVGEGIALGVTVAIGYSIGVAALAAAFEKKPETATWFWITAGYHLVGLTVASIILAVWD
jgi:Protein of unknown function (DUF1761)